MTASLLRARISDRAALADLSVSPHAIEQFSTYYLLLERWNRTINLTALPLADYPDGTIDRLIVEPLVAAPYLPAPPGQWFDLGSGGGSPALPLKIANPRTRLTMIESRERKAAFLREAVRTLELPDAEVLTARIEDVSADRSGTADFITARALNLEEVMRPAMTLLRSSGLFALFTTNKPVDSDKFEVDVVNRLPLPGASQLLLISKQR